MKIPTTPAPSRSWLLWATLLGCLVMGFLLGRIEQKVSIPSFQGSPTELRGNSGANTGTEAGRLPDTQSDFTEYDLPELRIDLTAKHYQQLLSDRAGSIARGHVPDDLKREHPARVGLSSDSASVRIKGDHLDHMLGDRWSLRVSLKNSTFLGLKSFSIQAPVTRAYLWEWFAHRAATRDELLAPRSMFVKLTLQGEPRGIYFLEEHFTKELLESQSRREGPIVKFSEDAFWMMLNLARFDSSEMITTSPGLPGSMVDAFGKRRLTSDHALSRQLSDALARLASLREAALVAREDGLFDGDARRELELSTAAWVEDLVDIEKTARVHALTSLLQAHHGLSRNNLRFYYDPVAAKLEPIIYDCSPMNPTYGTGPVGFSRKLYEKNALIRSYRTSPHYRECMALETARVVQAGFLEGLIADLRPELEDLQSQLIASKDMPVNMRVKRMINQLYGSRAELRKSLYPPKPLGAVCVQRQSETGAATLEIEIWSTTDIPVVIESFVFDNGVETPALPLCATPQASIGGGALILDAGRRWRFNLDADERLSGLVKIRGQLKDLSGGLEERPENGLNLDLRWRYASEQELHSYPLTSRIELDSWWSAGSRPRSPSLREALAAHPFLAWDAPQDRLMILPGTWNVRGDLVIPEGHPLHANAGVTLLFEPDAILLTHDALLFNANLESPILLAAQDASAGWAGLAVLNAKQASKWEHVWVRGAGAIERAGWITSGGASFYRSALSMLAGGIEDARGEDALNLFGAYGVLENVRFDGSASDALDADFVTLVVKACQFKNIGADAIDTSGSNATLTDCIFTDIGDKCISAGERSHVQISGGQIQNAAIGVASKDQSEVELRAMSMSGIRNFQLAAYRKKSAFGPASIISHDMGHSVEDLKLLVQTESKITLDGVEQPTVDFDPKQLYSTGLLGN